MAMNSVFPFFWRFIPQKTMVSAFGVAGVSLLFAGSPSVARSATPLSDQKLARACAEASIMVSFVELAAAGGQVVIDGKKVDSRNAAKTKADLIAVLERCKVAGEGQESLHFAAHWQAQQTGCERNPSLLGSISGVEHNTVQLAQQPGTLMLKIAGKMEDQSFAFDLNASLVGSAIALVDPGDSNFMWLGEATPARIELGPDTASILRRWPKWIPAPKPADLDSCRVVFLPRENAPVP